MFRAFVLVLIIVSVAGAQTTKPVAKKTVTARKPIPQQKLSRDFVVAGRRALKKIDVLYRTCTPQFCTTGSLNDIIENMGAANKAIDEADAVRANLADKQAVALLQNYARAAFEVTNEQFTKGLNALTADLKARGIGSGQPVAENQKCANGVCTGMYRHLQKRSGAIVR